MPILKLFCTLLLVAVSGFAQAGGTKLIDGNFTEMIYGSAGRSFKVDIVTIPNALTAVTTATVWIQALHCVNIHATDAVTFTMTNTAGDKFFNAISVPVNGVITANYNARGIRTVGIKWNSNTSSSMNCTITGVQE